MDIDEQSTEMSAFRGTRGLLKMSKIQHFNLKVNTAHSDDLPVISQWEKHGLH